jgi:hypothetical protein
MLAVATTLASIVASLVACDKTRAEPVALRGDGREGLYGAVLPGSETERELSHDDLVARAPPRIVVAAATAEDEEQDDDQEDECRCAH